MSRWTYWAGGVVIGSLLGLFSGQALPWVGWVGIALGAIAPHWFPRNRQAQAHSLLMACVSALVLYVLLWPGIFHIPWFAAGWLAGYLSHLLLDAITVPGVTMFWPSSMLAVLPKPEQYRIEPGTPAEKKLWIVPLITGSLLFPLQAVGLRNALHHLIQTPQAAEEDYLRHTHEHHRVWIEFDGFFTSSQRPVSGTWEAIHAPHANTLLLLDPDGRVHRIGNHPTDTLRPYRMRARRGERVQVQVREFPLKHQVLGELLSQLPKDAQVYLTGWAILEEEAVLRYIQEEFPTITLSGRRVEFNQTPLTEITRHRLQTAQALRGYLLVRLVQRGANVKR